MAHIVVSGATALCTFGSAPGTIMVTSQTTCLADGKPAATIQDVNITPFGLCSSLANNAVATATTAAMGVLTPMPCTPAITGPWIPTKPAVLIGGKPCLTSDCKAMCTCLGNISIASPGQIKAMVK